MAASVTSALLPRATCSRWRRPARQVRAVAREASKGAEGDSGAELLRTLPIVAGSAGFALTLANRTLSNVSPVLDSASAQVTATGAVARCTGTLPTHPPRHRRPPAPGASPPRRGPAGGGWPPGRAPPGPGVSTPPPPARPRAWRPGGVRTPRDTRTPPGNPQSRADVLAIVMSAVLLLTGFSWLSLKPKAREAVELEGEAADFVDPSMPPGLRDEVAWAWEAARGAAGATSLVLLVGGRCVAHQGLAARGHRPGSARPGDILAQAQASGRASYFSNLAPYPGRLELTAFLPENTQSALVQPVGDAGVLVVGHNQVRGFTKLDQSWVGGLGDKLGASLEQSDWRPKGARGGKGFA